MRRKSDTDVMEARDRAITEASSDLIQEIDAILEYVAKNTMGDYIKRDEVNDKLLDLRLKVASKS